MEIGTVKSKFKILFNYKKKTWRSISMKAKIKKQAKVFVWLRSFSVH